MWYRIELAKDGAVRSCIEVEGSFADKGKVYFIEAESKADAIKIAAGKYRAYRIAVNAKSNAHAKSLVARGLCYKCGRNPVNIKRSVNYCAVCLDKAVLRERQIKNGTRVPQKQLRYNEISDSQASDLLAKTPRNPRTVRNKPVVIQTHVAYEFVLAQYRSLSPVEFEAWLVSAIETAERERARLKAELACTT